MNRFFWAEGPIAVRHRRFRIARRQSALRVQRGVATLEFVMVLPVLAIVFIFLMQCGATVFTKARVTIDSRHEVWSERYQRDASEPFNFEDAGIITADAEDRIVVSPLTRMFPQPRSEQMITSGAWDHRKVDLNRQANLEQGLTLAMKGPGREFQGRIGSLENSLDDFGSVFDDLTSIESLRSLFDSGRLNDVAEAQVNSQIQNMLGDEFEIYQTVKEKWNAINGQAGSSEKIQARLDEELERSRAELQAKIDKLEPIETTLRDNSLTDLDTRLDGLLTDKDTDFESQATQAEIEEILNQLSSRSDALDASVTKLQRTLAQLLADDEQRKSELLDDRLRTDADKAGVEELMQPHIEKLIKLTRGTSSLKADLDAQIEKVRVTLEDGKAEETKTEVEQLKKSLEPFHQKILGAGLNDQQRRVLRSGNKYERASLLDALLGTSYLQELRSFASVSAAIEARMDLDIARMLGLHGELDEFIDGLRQGLNAPGEARSLPKLPREIGRLGEL